MKKYICTSCGNRIFFENSKCLKCGHDIGFDAGSLTMLALDPAETPGIYRSIAQKGVTDVRYCSNSIHGACNWLIPIDDPTGLCCACDLNRTIPNLSEWGSLEAWQDLERAKKRLVYALLRFGLPMDATDVDQAKLTFDFVRHASIGHLDGLITIDILETDAVERERQRQIFDEPYRALLGHLRHESGHFYWKLLIEHAGKIEKFRALFGDERNDYGAALQLHRNQGPQPDWPLHYVSAYASAHPWEDWAETWAHYLHLVSTVDTADAEGMDPRITRLKIGSIWSFKKVDIYRDETFSSLIKRWIPLTTALNSLSRCMGHHDFYPFVLSTGAIQKLHFVHDAIRAGTRRLRR
jgi:hypothetical protein